MQSNKNALSSLLTISLCAIFALGVATQIQAQDKKADPAGTWNWTVPGRNGGPERKMSLKLKMEGDKLTGMLISPGRQGGAPTETKIADGKLKGDEISFTVTREFNGNTMVTKYNGKVAADTIKGKWEFERNGETTTRDWEAKRETEKK
jgi:hypothetical protein